MKARLGGAEGIRASPRSRASTSEVVAQDDDRPLLGREPAEGHSSRSRSATVDAGSATDGPSIGVSSTSIGPRPRRRRTSMQERKTRRGAKRRTGPDREGRQVPPGADEGLLDRVSRELVVPEDESGSRVQPRDEQRRQARQRRHDRLGVLARRVPLVHGDPRVTARQSWSRSGSMSRRNAKRFPAGRG